MISRKVTNMTTAKTKTRLNIGHEPKAFEKKNVWICMSWNRNAFSDDHGLCSGTRHMFPKPVTF